MNTKLILAVAVFAGTATATAYTLDIQLATAQMGNMNMGGRNNGSKLEHEPELSDKWHRRDA